MYHLGNKPINVPLEGVQLVKRSFTFVLRVRDWDLAKNTHIPKRAPPRWAAWSNRRHPRISPAVSMAMRAFRAYRELTGILKHDVLHKTIFNVCMHTHSHTQDRIYAQIYISNLQQTCAKTPHYTKRCQPLPQLHMHNRSLTHSYCSPYTSCRKGNHGEENDAEFRLWHLCADCSEHCHHSPWLVTHTHTHTEKMLVVKNVLALGIFSKIVPLLKMGRGDRWLFCICSSPLWKSHLGKKQLYFATGNRNVGYL